MTPAQAKIHAERVTYGCACSMIGLVVGYIVAMIPPIDHDPQRLIALREVCLLHDTGLFTTYCNNYAERYSRIERK